MQEGQVERGAISTKLVVLIVLVIAAIVGGIVFKQYRTHIERSPETAGKNFVAAIVQKDGSTSYAMFSDVAKKQLAANDWNAWVVFAFDKYSGGQPKLVKKETVPDPNHTYSKDHDTVTRLRYEFPFSEKTYQYDVILVQSGETWKVGAVGGLQ